MKKYTLGFSLCLVLSGLFLASCQKKEPVPVPTPPPKHDPYRPCP